MGLPTNVGYYESTRGSTILRAKTPLYLVRPVNGSDSVLALSNWNGLGGKRDSIGANYDDFSVSSLNSTDSTKTSTNRKKKRKSDQRIQVIH